MLMYINQTTEINMFISRNTLVHIFRASVLVTILGIAIALTGFYELVFNHNKQQAFLFFDICMLPSLVGFCGLVFFVVSNKKIDYKKEKS